LGDSAIQAYLRHAAAWGRATERIGPFLALFTPGSPNPSLNYAIPDDEATPGPGDVAALVAAFERRALTPRLEYLPGAAPAVRAALVAGGFGTERTLAVMTCGRGGVITVPPPDGIEVIAPVTDDDHAGALAVAYEAYEDPLGAAAPAPSAIAGRRALVSRGGCVVLARDAAAGAAAGSALTEAAYGGTTELAAVAVSRAYTGRGIATAISSQLARWAFEREPALETIWLTPEDAGRARIYARVGFTETSAALHISR
jgi:GNAT superfamily N-acetyltransferase